jgi:hypothetical protein
MMARDPVEVTPSISTPAAPATAIQHKTLVPLLRMTQRLHFLEMLPFSEGFGRL